MSSLRVRGLRATYGRNEVLRGVDFDVEAGHLAAVLGPSGCGKTTMLRVLAGHHGATAGSVHAGARLLVDGAKSVLPERRSVTVVPQDGALFPHLSVARNVGFGLVRGSRSSSRSAADQRTQEMLELVGLEDLADRFPHQLSGGQQQRVAVARALAPRPDFVVMDEPFSALDVGLREELRVEVKLMLREQRATAVLVTHDQHEALSLADSVVLLRDGVVVQQATPEDLYARPVDSWAAQFVGESNLLPISRRDGSTVFTEMGPIAAAGTGDGKYVLVRPEHIRVTGSGQVRGLVLNVTFMGSHSVAMIRLHSGLLAKAHLRPGFARPGDVVGAEVIETGWIVG